MKFTSSQSWSSTTLITTLLLLSPATAIDPSQLKSLDDYFNVQPGTTNGGCDNFKTRIQNYLVDSNNLLEQFLAGVNNYAGDEVVRKNLFTYFNIKPARKKPIRGPETGATQAFNKVKETMNNMNKFFEGSIRTLVDPPETDDEGNEFGGKPFLFCDSTWLEETEDVFNIDGDQVFKDDGTTPENLRTYTGDPLLPEGLRKKTASGGFEIYAYWADVFKQYQFEKEKDRYPGTPPSWCKGGDANPPENRFGVTYDRLIRDSITLCNLAFENEAGTVDTLSDAQGLDAAKTFETDLDSVTPRSVTFFHELIHLTTGNDNTPDKATRTEESLQLAKTNRPQAFKNPDNYVTMAMSYFFTTKGPNTENGEQIDWSTGVAQELDLDTGSP